MCRFGATEGEAAQKRGIHFYSSSLFSFPAVPEANNMVDCYQVRQRQRQMHPMHAIGSVSKVGNRNRGLFLQHFDLQASGSHSM